MAVPDAVKRAGLSVQDRVVEFARKAKVRVCEKPLIAETVTVEVPDAPGAIVTLVGEADTPKSGGGPPTLEVTAYDTTTELDSVPLVPITVTVN